MSPTGSGLRQRKNEQTRQAITTAALEIASEVGFGQTTVAQIAERADVSPRTVHAWFPSKDDIIVVDASSARISQLEEALESDGDGDTLDRILLWLEDVSASRTEPRELMRQRYRILLSDPQLRALQRGRMEGVEKLIAVSMARESGHAPNALGPRALAAAIVTMLLAMQELFAYSRDADEADFASAVRMLRAAFDSL